MTTRATLIALAEMRRMLRPGRCPTCLYWDGYPVIGCDDRGNEIDRSEYPICPDCGREIEQQSERLLIGLSWADAA